MEKSESKNNKVILIGIMLIALVFIFTFFRSGFSKDKTANQTAPALNYPKITAEDLKNKLKDASGAEIIDIRSLNDYAIEHIPNSINAISEESFNGLSQAKTIALIGYSNQDEEYSKIIDYLKSKKINNIFILNGGIASWKGNGGSTISIGNPNSFVDNSKVVYITPEDLKAIIENKNYPRYILDVRAKQAFDSGHLNGAENISLDDLEKSSDKIPFGKELLVYGDTELQGFQGGVRLYDLGFMNFRVLKGGFASWKDKGFEIVK